MTMRIVVVLPAPFGPRRPRTEPWGTSKVTSLTAWIPPLNSLDRFSTAIGVSARSSRASARVPPGRNKRTASAMTRTLTNAISGQRHSGVPPDSSVMGFSGIATDEAASPIEYTAGPGGMRNA